MSWTTATLFANWGPPGYLGTFPKHLPNNARSLLVEKLGVKYAQSRLSNFDAGIRPPSGWFCVGAYEKAAIITGHSELYGMVEKPKTPLVKAAFELFSDAEILYFELAGGTGYFAFELHSAGQLERALAGDPERGIVINEGTLTPEERQLRLDESPPDEAIRKGETVVFEMTKRFLGVSLDHFPAEKLLVELIKKQSALLSFWR